MVGLAEDITERKHYEVALEKERQQLRQIVTNAPVAMAMFDSEMHYLGGRLGIATDRLSRVSRRYCHGFGEFENV